MIGELVREIAVLSSTLGWEFVGLVTTDNGEKILALRDPLDGEAVQITLTPGRAVPRPE